MSRRANFIRTRNRRQQSEPVYTAVDGTLEDKDDDFLCPICFDKLKEAHITRCGHTYCHTCILRSIDTHGPRCPKCGSAVQRDHLVPNFTLNELVAKSLARKKEQELYEQTDLSKVVGDQCDSLQLPDVNAVLERLRQRKRKLEADEAAEQRILLDGFLTNLLKRKQEELNRIQRQVQVLQRDLAENRSLANQESAPTKKDVESEPSTSKFPSLPSDYPELASKRKRIDVHLDDLVNCYFDYRTKNVVLDSESYCSSAFEKFSKDMRYFSKFSGLRPLATLNYTPDMYQPSNIVSSIEFDRDNEFFAIAGVTRRIKVFEYSVVIGDVVDIHYPCVEMVCNSKISCISWSSYHKGVLASSDYEGAVTLWDVNTGQKTKVLQEHEKRCWSVDFNLVDAGMIASGSDDSKVKLWTINADRAVGTLDTNANVCCVKFNPESRYHLAFGSADHCVHYYDIRNTKEALSVFEGHRKAVSYVKFANKNEIVSASTDSQLKLWDVPESKCRRSFLGHVNEKNFVGLATDGNYVACGSENNSLFMYYKGLSKHVFSFKFDHNRGIFDKDRKDDDASEFVSAVCWRQGYNVVVTANSQGLIKILELA